MTEVTKPSNYTNAQIDALMSYGKTFTYDVAKKFAADPLFAGKNARSIISKISQLKLPYEKAGSKAPTALKAKDETQLQIGDDIKALLGIAENVVLTQKTGFVAIRSAVQSLVDELNELRGETQGEGAEA